jgi:hypothetical protein
VADGCRGYTRTLQHHHFRQNENIQLRELGDGDIWSDIRKVLDAAVADKAKAESKQLTSTLHELFHCENEGLRATSNIERQYKKNS